MDDVNEAIGRTWTAPDAWEFLSALTDIGSRMAGSAGEREAASLVEEEFEAAGLSNVTREPFEIAAWERGTASLQVTEPTSRPFHALALPYSPAGEASGELVDVGYGTPEEIDERDVTDKIVVASTTTPPGGRFLHRMEKYGTAVEAGASAFVFANHVPGQLPPTGSLTFGREASIPAIGVSKETGDRLRAYAGAATEGRAPVGEGADEPGRSDAGGSNEADGGEADTAVGRATVTVEARTEPGESVNVTGRLGPDTDRRLLVTAHHDAHDVAEGALDNGCGIATLVTAARILATADLDRGVTFAAVGSEEVGLLGAERLAAETPLESVAGVVNLDGVGRFRNLVALSHASDATADVARTVADRTRHPIELREQPHPFSDQWPFVRQGVPALQLHSTADEPAAGIGGLAADRGRGWGHTEADTRDKVDVRNVREHAMLAALLIREAASRELPRLDLDELRTAFREADFEPGMRAANLWPDDWD